MPAKTQTESIQPDARERLLDAALVLFTQRGYAASSVREICAAAGVTKPVLYYYFGSKEGLYLQLMEKSYALFESLVPRLTSYAGPVRQRVIHICEGLFDISTQKLDIVRLIYSIYYGTPQGAPAYNFDRYYDRLLEIVAGLVREGIEQGEFRAGDVGDMTWAILSCLNIAIEEQLSHCTPRIGREAMTRILNLFFEGMAENEPHG